MEERIHVSKQSKLARTRRVIATATAAVSLIGFAETAHASPGLSATDVKTLQQDANEDLVRLGMPQLAVDGKLGRLTLRALCIERWLTNNTDSRNIGRTTSADITLLDSLDTLEVPKPLNLRVTELNNRTEYKTYTVVNKTCQAMAVVANNELISVVPVSTGTPEHDTPTGVFFATSVRRGWHDSTKYPSETGNGNMLNPVYFMPDSGIAIHGSSAMTNNSTVPASHGCVRIRPEDSEVFYTFAGGKSDAPVDTLEGIRKLPVVVMGEFSPTVN